MRAHFRDDVESSLVVDASAKDSICAILMQEGRMVMCASRTLTAREQEWHITEKEMLAVKFGCKKFRVYILGRMTKLYTDHEPLLGVLRKLEQDNKRLLGFKADISEFLLEPHYVPGLCNKADYWTRLGVSDSTNRPESTVAILGDLNWSKAYTTGDMREIKDCGSMSRVSSVGMEVRVKGVWRLFVPLRKRRGLCWWVHRHRHPGVTGMLDRLEGYHWPGKHQFVQEMLDGCACALTKAGALPKNKLLKSMTGSVTEPMQLLALDIFSYDDCDYLTGMDIYSGYPFIKALPEGHAQGKVLDKFEELESEIGEAGRLLTDRGAEFGMITGYARSQTAAYHPEGNGKLERFHKELANLARVHKVSPVQAIRYYRTDEQRRLFFGRPVPETKALDYGVASGPVARAFVVGDLVSRFIPRRSRTKKSDVWSEPQRVLKKIGDRNYLLWNGYHMVTVHINDIKRVKVPSGVGWSINSVFLDQLCDEWVLDKSVLLQAEDVAGALAQRWAGKQILLPINVREIPAVLEKVGREQPDQVLTVVPNLPGEEWFKTLAKLPALWVPFPGKEDDFVDEDGKGMGLFCISFWAVLLG